MDEMTERECRIVAMLRRDAAHFRTLRGEVARITSDAIMDAADAVERLISAEAAQRRNAERPDG